MKRPLSKLKPLCLVKCTTGIGIALFIYTLVGFFLLPAIIKWQLLKRLPAITQRTVALQQVKLNPFVLSLTIRGLTLKEPNGDVFYSFDELYLNLQLVSILKRAFVFKEIKLKKPFGRIIFQRDGKFNFANLLSASPSERQQVPDFAVERLDIEVGRIFFADEKRKFLLKLSQIGLTLKGFSNQTNAPVSTTLSMLCNETGTIAWQGTALPFARSADIHVQVTDLDLRALQSYVEEIWKLEITGGVLSATGRVLVAAAGQARPLVQFTGELGVAHFASVDTKAREELLKLASLRLTGLDLRYQPHRLDIAAVNIAGLQGNMIILPDKGSNWKGMVKNAEKLHELIVELQLNNLFPFQIGTVSLENSSFAFSDRSIEPQVVDEIQDVAGSVSGLSSTKEATARVDLHGRVDGHSPLTISGTINPLADDLRIDLVLSLKDGEMPPGSPYAAKYIGYPIHQGQLSLDAHYTLNQRVLKAENKFRARHLRLGAKNNSPDATPLRIKLAVALLQDRDGVLPFDVLVNGNLDDPNFKLGPVFTQVFMNIITKTVSNPFGLLGSLFGSDEQLSFVSFAPGRADFADGETKKLDTLAKALDARPALELEITGSVDPTGDRIALARIKLNQQLKARRIEELTAAGNTVVASDTITITPQDYERLIKLIYVEVVGRDPVDITESPGPQQNFGPRIPSGPEANLMPQLPRRVTKAFEDLTLADMEAVLIDRTAVTPDDFRGLMQARADKTLNCLVQAGQVAAERLFIVAPKPVGPSYQGKNRVDLSLQ